MSNLISVSRAKLTQLLPKGRFVRNVGKLAGGVAMGQLVVIATMPILTRLYSPADFGVLAVFSTLLSIVAAVISLRYELTIPLAENDADAANLLFLSLALITAGSGLLLLVVLLWGEAITRLAQAPALLPYLWLLPVVIACTGIYQVFNYWLIRKQAFDHVAQTKFTQGLGNSLTSIALGLLSVQPLGLLIGQLVGQSAGMTTLMRVSWVGGVKQLLPQVSWPRMRVLAEQFKDFALFSTPSSLINNVGLWIPPLLFAGFYGPVVAGFVALGDRISRIPFNLISRSIADVYYSEAAKLQHQPKELQRLFLRTARHLLWLGAIPCLPMLLLSPWLVKIIFGAEWYQAGIYLQWIALAVLAQFVANPLSYTLTVLKRPDLNAIWDILRLILVAGSIGLSHSMGWSYTVAFGLYAGGVALSYAILLLMSYTTLERRVRAGGQS